VFHQVASTELTPNNANRLLETANLQLRQATLQAAYANNLMACIGSSTGCDHASLTAADAANVAGLQHALNLQHCMEGSGAACEPALLTPKEAAQVENFKYPENLLRCLKDSNVDCDHALLTPSQANQVAAVEQGRIQLLHAANLFACLDAIPGAMPLDCTRPR